jgi:hypothetical protein
MHLPVIGFLIVLLAIAFFGLSFSKTARADEKPAAITRKAIRSLTREQIQQKLKTLEAAKAPEPKMGAMCYKMAAPPDRAEYVCPVCSEKTLYTSQSARFIAWELDACRREFELLKKETDLAVALNESALCSHCAPSAAAHELALTVTYADGATHTTAPVSHQDLVILRHFLKGNLDYKTFNDGTLPLQKALPRLRELLGADPTRK